MNFSDRILRKALAATVMRGNLVVTTASKAVWSVGDGTGEAIPLRFSDTKAQWAFLTDPDMRMGELFMDGRLSTDPGRIYDVIFLLLQDYRNVRTPRYLQAIDTSRAAFQRLIERNNPMRSRRNVAHHYDLDGRLYELFLDEDRQYSCAYFEHPDATIDEAQRAKKRHIAGKLLLDGRQKVLDIGCGWGGMGEFLASKAGAAEVLGISLSSEQIAYAKAREGVKALGNRIEFALRDYRSVTGSFARIVSVGMFEHVGRAHFNEFFLKCESLLDADGLMLLHTIGWSDGPGYVTPWVTKYIFPGGYIPGLSEIVRSAERARLIVSDVEILQLHYALTLRHWRERFLARRAEALKLYDERFCLMWEFYLAAAEVAFRCEALAVFQLQLVKRIGVTPMTRNYVAEREAQLK